MSLPDCIYFKIFFIKKNKFLIRYLPKTIYSLLVKMFTVMAIVMRTNEFPMQLFLIESTLVSLTAAVNFYPRSYVLL